MLKTRSLSTLSKRSRAAVAVVAFTGVGMMTVPAFAADGSSSSTSSSFKLTLVDEDRVVASGHNFPASTDIAVDITSNGLEGRGTIKADESGRLLFAVALPAGFDDDVHVNGPGGAHSKLHVTVPGAPTTTVPTTAAPAAPVAQQISSSTTAFKQASLAVAPSARVLSMPGGKAYSDAIAAFNAPLQSYNDRVKQIGNGVTAFPNGDLAAFAAKVDAINETVADLNKQTDALNTRAEKAANRADKASSDSELNIIDLQYKLLASKFNDKAADAKELSNELNAAVTDLAISANK